MQSKNDGKQYCLQCGRHYLPLNGTRLGRLTVER
jgi:hypothetical protein